VQLICQACGKEFEGKSKRKYCPSCSKREEVCIVCGKTFTTERFDQTKCEKCVGKAPRKPSKAGEVKCAMCGTIFMAKNAEIAKYCPECRKIDHYKKKKAGVMDVASDNQKMVQVRCAHCKEVFSCTWQQYRRGRKYCGTDCRDNAQRKRTEEKYGPTPVEEKIEQVVEIPYEPHQNQVPFHRSNARFRVLCCGARFGKDRASINEFIRKFADMLSENRDDTLVPRVMGWLIAPTYPLARQNWMELKYFFPEQWIVGKPNEAERQLKTVQGGLIEVKSADDPDSLVSVGLDIALFTEFAKAKKQEEVFANVRARLSSPKRGPNGKGGIGLFNSTPKGMDLLYQMYNWGQNPNMPEWESWHYRTEDNPYITKEEIESMRQSMTERMFRQECLAEFLTDGGEVFPNVEEVCTGIQQEPEMGMRYSAGWDPAHAGDFSAFAIRNDRGELVYLVRWTGMPWTIQLDRIQSLCTRYNHAHIDIDRTGLGETLPEACAQRGLTVEGHFFSNLFKEQLVNHFALLCEQKDVVLIDDKALKEEMKAYTYTTTKTGKINYSHPAGGHDDLITAVMLAYKDYNSVGTVLPWRGFLGGIKKKVI